LIQLHLLWKKAKRVSDTAGAGCFPLSRLTVLGPDPVAPFFISSLHTNMASLIFAASYMTYNKIKTKREEKKEKKRKAYADRYSELERETKGTQKDVQRPSTRESQGTANIQSLPVQSAELRDRRNSSESLRSDGEKTDGPSAWVDEVLRERLGGGTQSPRSGGHQEENPQSLV
jgi:hypothetical protein